MKSIYDSIEDFISLNHPVSVRTLYQHFDCSHAVVRMAVSSLHRQRKRIYIKKWCRETQGAKPRMLPLFAPGNEPDAPRPAKPKNYRKQAEVEPEAPEPYFPRVRSIFDLGARLNGHEGRRSART
jgi:hypothetical protein